ncbi:MAG: THUMP domain-containing protein [Bacteroidales bacterium]|nr:THUMP domain-containing protein [Bacteroidales bacterium]
MEEKFKMVAKTMAGLEDLLVEELTALGAENVEKLYRAVSFEGDNEIMYKANYLCRTALRILKPVVKFVARDEIALYNNVAKIEWHNFFSLDETFAIDAVASGPYFTHSQYVALKVKDAIADEFRQHFGARPSVDVDNPTIRINVYIENEKVTLSLDSSGDSLHKRGYRKVVDKAPMNEVLAAALIKFTGWDYDCNFVDCMCGSGTIPIEAAMAAMNIPAGYFRESYGFMSWHDFEEGTWDKMKAEADDAIRDFDFEIFASDHSAKAVDIARQNIAAAHLSHDINLSKQDMFELIPPEGGGVMLINPPYGERLEEDDIVKLYKGIGDALKQHFKGFSAWIISSDKDSMKQIGLKPSKKIELFNGPLECKLEKFEIFDGSYKDQKIGVYEIFDPENDEARQTLLSMKDENDADIQCEAYPIEDAESEE